ncbi:MAG: methyl-coenzyme M reductase subunit beta, partial [Methanolobus sp.]|nr:methyl-coenzyme M reductase subunit beta [Methanolobus sp.]
MSDKIDIYDDRGKLLESGVDLMDIAPTRNAAIQNIIKDTKRTVAVNLAGIEKALKTGAMGGKARKILGRELDYDIVGNAGAIQDAVAKLVSVREDDDTNVKELGGGKQMIVQVPSVRAQVGADYVSASTVTGAAVVQTIIDMFNVDMFDAPIIKSAVWGSYPQTMDMSGANIASILSIP